MITEKSLYGIINDRRKEIFDYFTKNRCTTYSYDQYLDNISDLYEDYLNKKLVYREENPQSQHNLITCNRKIWTYYYNDEDNIKCCVGACESRIIYPDKFKSNDE